MKKVLAVTLLALLLLLTACGGNGGGNGTTTGTPVNTNPPATDVTTTPPAVDTTTEKPADVTTTPSGSVEVTTPAVTDPVDPGEPIDPNATQIATAADLLAFMASPKLDGSYVLTADITLNDIANVANWATTAPATAWTPVGSVSAPFTGSFDGRGHKITGLYVSVDEAAGFFGCISGATVKNLVIGEGFISATTKVAGGISGYYGDGISLEGCVNLATVVSKQYVGGMIGCETGTITTGMIINCVNRGRIAGFSTGSSGAATYAGGIIGQYKSILIESCANFGHVSVGYDLNGNVISDKAAIVGGIAGVMANTGAAIKNCYNAGTVSASVNTGNAAIGGIVGRMNTNGLEVSDCYNTGKVLVRAEGSTMEMNAYVAAPNGSGVDYSSNLYNSGKMYNVASGSEVETTPKNTEKGLVGAVATGSGAVAKMNFGSAIWEDTATGAPILKGISADWQK